MAANTQPIFSIAADFQWQAAPLVTANNTADLTTGTVYLVHTAPTEGSFVKEVRLKALPGNSTIATVARLWINNGSTVATALNSTLWQETGIPATTTSATAPQPDFVIGANIALPGGYKLYVTLGTAPGGSGAFNAGCQAGRY